MTRKDWTIALIVSISHAGSLIKNCLPTMPVILPMTTDSRSRIFLLSLRQWGLINFLTFKEKDGSAPHAEEPCCSIIINATNAVKNGKSRLFISPQLVVVKIIKHFKRNTVGLVCTQGFVQVLEIVSYYHILLVVYSIFPCEG
jgi:hypothetical protein